MNTYKVDYCNSKGFLIKNERFKYNYIQNLTKKLNTNILEIYDKSYTDRLLHVIKNKNMAVTYISGGKYVYLYCTKIYNEPISMILELESKNNNINPRIISVSLNFNKDVFNETLFYGELYRNHEGKWIFLIENLKLYKNKIINNVYNSIKICNNLIKNEYNYNQLSPFLLKNKKFFQLNNIENSVNEILRNKIQFKGVKFYGLSNPIVFYINTNNYRNKENNYIEFPTIDSKLDEKKKLINIEYDNELSLTNKNVNDTFEYQLNVLYLELRFTNSYGVYEVYGRQLDKLILVGKARINSIEISNQLLNLNKNSVIVKVVYSFIFKKFTVLSIENGTIDNINKIKKEISNYDGIELPSYIKDCN